MFIQMDKLIYEREHWATRRTVRKCSTDWQQMNNLNMSSTLHQTLPSTSSVLDLRRLRVVACYSQTKTTRQLFSHLYTFTRRKKKMNARHYSSLIGMKGLTHAISLERHWDVFKLQYFVVPLNFWNAISHCTGEGKVIWFVCLLVCFPVEFVANYKS